MWEYGFGIDVGGTAIKTGLFRQDGTVVGQWQFPTDVRDNGSRILPHINDMVRRVMESHRLTSEQVAGLGIGVPGPVLADGTVLGCVNLGWGVLNLPELLGRLTGLPVRAANDANLAALGESWRGAGQGYDSVLLVTLGTGVGGGVVLNGRVLTGRRGGAGEIGHLPMFPEMEDACSCGKRGCMEQLGSATGLLREAKGLGVTGPEPLTPKAVCDLARQGDLLALEALHRTADAVGRGLANACCLVDPEIILIGGGLSLAGDILLDPIRAALERYVFPPLRGTPVLPAALSNDAGIFGGARLIFDSSEVRAVPQCQRAADFETPAAPR